MKGGSFWEGKLSLLGDCSELGVEECTCSTILHRPSSICLQSLHQYKEIPLHGQKEIVVMMVGGDDGDGVVDGDGKVMMVDDGWGC